MTPEGYLHTSTLINRLVSELRAEFPGWQISREHSGRWAATRPGWGALYGQCSNELRTRLRRYSPEGGRR